MSNDGASCGAGVAGFGSFAVTNAGAGAEECRTQNGPDRPHVLLQRTQNRRRVPQDVDALRTGDRQERWDSCGEDEGCAVDALDPHDELRGLPTDPKIMSICVACAVELSQHTTGQNKGDTYGVIIELCKTAPARSIDELRMRINHGAILLKQAIDDDEPYWARLRGFEDIMIEPANRRTRDLQALLDSKIDTPVGNNDVTTLCERRDHARYCRETLRNPGGPQLPTPYLREGLYRANFDGFVASEAHKVVAGKIKNMLASFGLGPFAPETSGRLVWTRDRIVLLDTSEKSLAVADLMFAAVPQEYDCELGCSVRVFINDDDYLR
ncbi:hypothetical protein EDB85DRAFT_1900128 [Lactarius pseudohatsudake]|nr:hypothetical protein EDB85DRAFT_1900128 [Lactarius pseudohatsudake]